MGEVEDIRKRLKKNRLSFLWLIHQLAENGIKTNKSDVSLIFAGKRKGDKVDSIIQETEKILDVYEQWQVFTRVMHDNGYPVQKNVPPPSSEESDKEE